MENMVEFHDIFSFDIESETLRAWRNDEYTAMLKKDKVSGLIRLSVRRDVGTEVDEPISWEDLQEIKNQCLGEDVECIELYPRQSDVVNKENHRHLWVYDGECPYRFPKTAAVSDEEALKIILRKLGIYIGQ